MEYANIKLLPSSMVRNYIDIPNNNTHTGWFRSQP